MKHMPVHLRTAVLFLFLAAVSCKKEHLLSVGGLSVTGIGPIAAGTGDPMFIYGTGFDPVPENNQVSFNGVSAEVVSVSPGRLTVIVPLLASAGKVVVSAHGATASSASEFSPVTVLRGTYSESHTLTPDRKYLLRGNVVFTAEAKLSIQAGAIIFAEKETNASLSATNLDIEGTATNPVVFTSNQAAGGRAPGDWQGITINELGKLSANNTSGNYRIVNTDVRPYGIMRYVRIEFAGNHNLYTSPLESNFNSNGFGLALYTGRNNIQDVLDHVQVSYSAGGGFYFLNTGVNFFSRNLIALACAGNDFQITGPMTAQFCLGLKDPYLADPQGADGLRVYSFVQNVDGNNDLSPANLSNFTLIGGNPQARNIVSVLGLAANANSGRGVHIGGQTAYSFQKTGVQISNGHCSISNSLIAGSWLAGVSIDGAAAWNIFEATSGDQILLRNNFLTGIAANTVDATPASTAQGGIFGRENFSGPTSRFDEIQKKQSLKFNTFFASNDSTGTLDFGSSSDDLLISKTCDYQNFNSPVLSPAVGSPLLSGSVYVEGTPSADASFLRVPFAGAFGTVDWSTPWSQFDPQKQKY